MASELRAERERDAVISKELRHKASELVEAALALATKLNCYDLVANPVVNDDTVFLKKLNDSKTIAYLEFLVSNWNPKALDSTVFDNYSNDELWVYLCDAFRIVGKIEAGGDTQILGIEEAIRNFRSSFGKLGADALHSKEGGSRDKQDKIRQIWASGKYRSRSICAEQECAALDMSFDTARKALRNTPDPA